MNKTLYPNQATYVNANWPGDNYGGTDYLHAGVGSVSSKQNLTLIQFSLAGIPNGSVINSATMRLYSYNSDSYRADTTLLAKRNTSAFTASTVTFSTKPQTTDSNQSTCTDGGYDIWFEWNVTEIARAWMTGTSNFGLTIVQSGTAVEHVKCFKKSGAYAPQLVVDYTEPTPPGKATGLAITPNPFEGNPVFYWLPGTDGYNNPKRGYNVYFRLNGGGWMFLKYTTSTSVMLELGEYPRGTQVECRVDTCSVYCIPVPSDCSSIAIKNRLPNKLTNVNLTKPIYVPGEPVRVTFTKPTDPDNNLRGFEVETSGSTAIARINDSNAVYVEVSTIGWTPGVSYTFKVRAYDMLGACSPWSDTVSALVGLPMKVALTGNVANKQVAQMKVFVTEGGAVKTVKSMKVALAGGSNFKTVF